MSHPNFLDWRSESRAFESLAATNNAGFTWTSKGEAEVVLGLRVTATFLPTLKISPALGRNFLESEDRPGGNSRVVLLGDGFWRRAFGADPTVVGRTITLNSQPYTIIGVLPPTFRWGINNDMLAPLAPDPARNRADHRLLVIGRVAAGRSIDQARTELETIAARLGQQYPESNKGWGIVVRSFCDWLVAGPCGDRRHRWRRRRARADACDEDAAVLGVAHGSDHLRRGAGRVDCRGGPGLLSAGQARDEGRSGRGSTR